MSCLDGCKEAFQSRGRRRESIKENWCFSEANKKDYAHWSGSQAMQLGIVGSYPFTMSMMENIYLMYEYQRASRCRFRLKPTNSASVVRQILTDRRYHFLGGGPLFLSLGCVASQAKPHQPSPAPFKFERHLRIPSPHNHHIQQPFILLPNDKNQHWRSQFHHHYYKRTPGP